MKTRKVLELQTLQGPWIKSTFNDDPSAFGQALRTLVEHNDSATVRVDGITYRVRDLKCDSCGQSLPDNE